MTDTRVTADVISAIGEGAVETRVTAYAVFAIADAYSPRMFYRGMMLLGA